MENDRLTVAKALKFARHDFLNELQLILLYIDLGQLPEARQKILETTNSMRQVAMLEKLGLPKTEIWLATFDWVYNVFSQTMTCDITPGIRQVNDATVAIYLEQLFKDAEAVVDSASDYETRIDVKASSTDWSITITVDGVMDNKLPAPEATGDFTVQETISHNQWTFTISGR